GDRFANRTQKNQHHLIADPGAAFAVRAEWHERGRRMQSNTEEPTDRELLQRFGSSGDQDAFALLVARYGQLVLSVCLRRLRHFHDAEDAFQATFLVLARKAATMEWHDSVANWLNAVAIRVASEARRLQMRRQAREHAVDVDFPAAEPEESLPQELVS